MSAKTWKIRDQLPSGKWGPEREVTLEQFRADNASKAKAGTVIFRASVEAVEQAR